MHDRDQLNPAGAEFVALWPQELLTHLLGPESARPAARAWAVPGAIALERVSIAVEVGPAAGAVAFRRARFPSRGARVSAADPAGVVATERNTKVRRGFTGEDTLRELRQASALLLG